MGSIDTISYDKRYEKAVKDFEEQTSRLVYHVIKRGNTISLLFVELSLLSSTRASKIVL